MAKKEKSLMRQLIDERGIKDVAGVQALVKELTAEQSLKATSGTASTTTGINKRTTAGMAATRKLLPAARVMWN